MITAVSVFLGLIIAGLVTGLLAATTAPLGYEDETGFHFGSESGMDFGEVGSGNAGWAHPASSHA